jgi:hypothetical protein
MVKTPKKAKVKLSENGITKITKNKNNFRKEKSLHHDVVDFWRKTYPDILLSPGNGEVKFKAVGLVSQIEELVPVSMKTSDCKRKIFAIVAQIESKIRNQIIRSYKQNGYDPGTPDLIANAKARIILPSGRVKEFTQLAFEFKRENGKGQIQENQEEALEKLRNQGAYTYIGNDYDDILRISTCYMNGQPWSELLDSTQTISSHTTQSPKKERRLGHNPLEEVIELE